MKKFKYTDRHKGEIILVLGTGPSINDIDPNLFNNFTTIGVNNISDTVYDPDYLVILDMVACSTYNDIITDSEAIKFYTGNKAEDFMYHRFIKHIQATIEHPMMSKHFEDGLFWSNTSIFPAISLAYVFGAKAIVLVGVDMNNNAHCYDDDDGTKNSLHEFPETNQVLHDFGKLKQFADKNGVDIYNINEKSAVRNFSFVDFDKGFVDYVKDKYKLRKVTRRVKLQEYS